MTRVRGLANSEYDSDEITEMTGVTKMTRVMR